MRGYLGTTTSSSLSTPGVFTSIFLALGMFESYLLGYLVHWRTMCWVLTTQVPVVVPVLVVLVLW